VTNECVDREGRIVVQYLACMNCARVR